MPPLWLPVLIKALSTAFVVVLASALAESIGPFWGALVASLPVSAGPAYVFLSMQHDDGFIAVSALSSFAANAATGAFLIVYALAVGRLSRWCSLGSAVAVWFLASFLIGRIVWTPAEAVLLNLGVYGCGFLTLRDVGTVPSQPNPAAVRRWCDLPLRAGAIALFVSLVTMLSAMLGARATGIATVFPISLTSLIIILQSRLGVSALALMAVTALRAMLGFGLALLTLHLMVRPWGTSPALIAALFVSLAWSAVLTRLRARPLRRIGQATSTTRIRSSLPGRRD